MNHCCGAITTTFDDHEFKKKEILFVDWIMYCRLLVHLLKVNALKNGCTNLTAMSTQMCKFHPL